MEVMGDDAGVDECFRAADDVLRNAVGGIAEVITNHGLINVDFEDVRTVMGETGRAMMGSASAAGVDRARIAAVKAIASPLLDGVDLSGARGVLVNITASRNGLKMKEVNEVMNTVKEFAADDAHIIFGAVFDETMTEELRVTVVATGLGRQSVRQPFKIIETETLVTTHARTGTDDAVGMLHPNAGGGYEQYETPAVFRNPRSSTSASTKVDALVNSGVDRYDIPAFLRKQAD
jgi:cell division protein FtsZ